MAGIRLALPLNPPVFVEKRAIKGGMGWAEIDAGAEHMVVRAGPGQHVLVVSHHCEIDKGESKKRIHVAPIMPMSGLTQPGALALTAAGRRVSKMPLPGIPGLGDMYADLRVLQPIDRRALDAATVIASMNDAAVELLRQHLAAFFARPNAAVEEDE